MASPHKTNGIRILESSKIPYKTHEYEAPEGFLDGVAAAHAIGLPEEKVYKTLVTLGHSKGVYVFVIPVAAELDLKKAAKAAKEKKMDMLPAKDITPVTGYIKGGCSPVGMKKNYPTILEESCRTLDTMVVSAGRVGLQMELDPADLIAVTRGETASLIKE
jgi:Cys-tRNA(Pro)/Cys-tRNA(Cys) deacylase